MKDQIKSERMGFPSDAVGKTYSEEEFFKLLGDLDLDVEQISDEELDAYVRRQLEEQERSQTVRAGNLMKDK